MKIPRDYQEQANLALWNFIHNRPGMNPLVVEATGLGKSLNIAMFIWMWLTYYPHTRIMQVTHSKELVEGNYLELLGLWPSAPAGVYSAGLNQRDLRSQVTFCGIQSVHARAASFGHIDFLIVDEAHTISANESATYSKFIAALKKRNPYLVVIGFTATPFRMTTGLLTDGDMFDEIVYDIGSGESFVWAVEQGYLIRPVPKYPGFQLDSDGVGITAGEFDNKAASQAMADQDILERAVDTCIALGEEQGRVAWLHFCQSIEDAELVADMFSYKGHPHEAVHSKRSDRDDILQAFKEGGLRGVTNRDVLTTGFNHPNIDLIGMLRLTRSPGLWVQMVGRGTRPVWMMGYDISTFEGRHNSILASPKQTCLVLDFVGNTSRLGPINYPRLPSRRGKKGPPQEMTRLCPKCDSYCHISQRLCPDCGYEFPPPERLRANASESALVTSNGLDLTKQPPPREIEIFGVNRMICAHHNGRDGKPDTMRVDYFSGHRRFSSWIGFEHPENSFPLRKAREWWAMHGGQGDAPTTVLDALEVVADLRKPKFLKVWTNTKYPEIQDYDFRGTRFELPPEIGGPPLQEPEPDPTEEARLAAEAFSAAYAENNAGTYYDDDIPF